MTISDTHDIPALPRTVTAPYVFAPTRPVTVPSAHLCSDTELLDLAAGAVAHPEQLWQLVGQQDYVRAICQLLVERVEPARQDLATKLAASDRAVVQLRLELATVQAKLSRECLAHAETIAQCCELMRDSIADAQVSPRAADRQSSGPSEAQGG
jgi:hypothetical protein